MTNQGAFAGTRPVTWPRAAMGAAFFLGLMIILFVVVPNHFVTSDPSQLTKIITIAYAVVLFAGVAWMIAAWQNRGRSESTPVTDKVSVFGRPMREGPGFASFSEKTAPSTQQPATHARSVGSESVKDASAFGRPLKKGSK